MASIISLCIRNRIISSSTRHLLSASRVLGANSSANYSSFQFSSKKNSARPNPSFVPSRTFLKKPIPPDALGPLLFGAGVLGAALGLNLYLKRRENRYGDPSYHPVYEKYVSLLMLIHRFLSAIHVFLHFF